MISLAALCALFTFLVSAAQSYAQSREFTNPHVRGVRLDLCKHQGGRGCGKPAADLFCKEMNFSRSIGHTVDPRTGEAIGRTLIFGDGALCNGIQCRAFASILCLKDEVIKTPVPEPALPPKTEAPKKPAKKAEKKPRPSKPAPAANALQGAAAVGQRLDRSALAARAMALSVEARLMPAQSAALKTLGRNFGRTGNQAALLQSWQVYLAANRPAPGDVDGLIQLVLRESYLQASEDLRHYAAKVMHMNQQKAEIREQAKNSGSTPPAGDSGQLANIDLQSATQKQQQTLQMTANISKAMHDTAMAVIRGVK